MDNIYLVGFMGTGKTTTSIEIAKLLPFQIVEMDGGIETLANMTIPEIFEKFGENYFRDIETSLLKIVATKKNQIVSCGGGIVLRQENIDIMKSSGTVILLSATPETVYENTQCDSNRPLLKDKKTVEDIKAMMEVRQQYYEKAADIKVLVDGLAPAEIASKVIEQLALAGRLI